MADLTFFQKYPMAGEPDGDKSVRLHHPDFGNVLETTFAKGTITDFELVTADPIKVNSKVKVQVEGMEESGFIPIFFHPKAQYWDDPGDPPSPISATDFNETEKYFERAWMSFRGGDEVVVMLHAGVPVRVIGFSDGVPRIGENIIQRICEDLPVERQTCLLDCLNKEHYYDSDWITTGPDGEDLNLLQESEVVTDLDAEEEATWAPQTLLPQVLDYNSPPQIETFYPDSEILAYQYLDGTCDWDGDEYIFTCTDFTLLNSELSTTPYIHAYVTEFAVIVGPILYLIQILSAIAKTKRRLFRWEGCGYFGSGCSFAGADFLGGDPDSYTDQPDSAEVTTISTINIKAGIYTEDLLNSIKNASKLDPADQYATFSAQADPEDDDWANDYPGMTTQTNFTENYDYDEAYPLNLVLGNTFSYWTRPHTKVELQAASMWPIEEGA